jgi:hypothetical protein
VPVPTGVEPEAGRVRKWTCINGMGRLEYPPARAASSPIFCLPEYPPVSILHEALVYRQAGAAFLGNNVFHIPEETPDRDYGPRPDTYSTPGWTPVGTYPRVGSVAAWAGLGNGNNRRASFARGVCARERPKGAGRGHAGDGDLCLSSCGGPAARGERDDLAEVLCLRLGTATLMASCVATSLLVAHKYGLYSSNQRMK